MEKQKAQQHEEYMAPPVFTNGICHHPKQESISPKYGIFMNKIAATPRSARAVRHGFQYKKNIANLQVSCYNGNNGWAV